MLVLWFTSEVKIYHSCRDRKMSPPSVNAIRIGESPSKYPFLKNNGSEAPKGPRIHYFSGMDTYEDFLRLKIHHTLAPLFRYNKRF